MIVQTGSGLHRAHRRNMSLDASGPHRMMNGASAIGAWCWHSGA